MATPNRHLTAHLLLSLSNVYFERTPTIDSALYKLYI